jgi:hypothetical protein
MLDMSKTLGVAWVHVVDAGALHDEAWHVVHCQSIHPSDGDMIGSFKLYSVQLKSLL